MNNASMITFDIDWAPDWSIALCRDLCAKYGVQATFFATHDSGVVMELRGDTNFEVGIHPNFMAGSTHGGSFEEVMDHCLRIVPNAEAMRTHGLYQSTPIFMKLLKHYPRIHTDVSLFLPQHLGLCAVFWHLDESLPPLTRLPYFWEDDIAASNPYWCWDGEIPQSEGLRIFNFHPIHVALNTGSMVGYRRVKGTLAGRPLSKVALPELGQFANEGPGTRVFLERLLKTRETAQFRKVSEVATAARKLYLTGHA